jgi:DNA topoisomerase-1
VLDRLVGYQVSPILWEKVRRGLSAGRVQSVAVRLICEREKRIKAFVPKEYWSITAEFEGREAEADFKAKLVKKDNKKLEIRSEDEAKRILAELKGVGFVVNLIEKKERKKNPMPPFITSRLQQEASRKLRFTAKKTMAMAQQLYEGVEIGPDGLVGLITYMRTDSTRLSSEAIGAVRAFIKQNYGDDYLPSKPAAYRSKMKPALLDQTRVDIGAGRYIFQANGTVVKFPGFTIVYEEGKDIEEEKEGQLPALKKGEDLTVKTLLPQQHFTQPPARFTEATLVKELEDNGIGRPSTYAAILSTIQEREYVVKEKNLLKPTELGSLITDLLVKSFPTILDVAFTAHMEEELDMVEEGKLPWLGVMKEFYGPFKEDLERAKSEMKSVKTEEDRRDPH